MRRILARGYLGLARLSRRVATRGFTWVVAGALGRCGRGTVLVPPCTLFGEGRIEIGARVYVGAHCWLQALADGDNRRRAIEIGDGSKLAGGVSIFAVREVVLEDDVLVARNVYISDHIHRYDDVTQPIHAQGVANIEPVRIKKGAWICQNVVVCPGVTIGAGSVVGANSVVKDDIPDYCVAAGSPARVIKKIGKAAA